MTGPRSSPIAVGIVADRETTREALVAVIAHDSDLAVAGTAADRRGPPAAGRSGAAGAAGEPRPLGAQRDARRASNLSGSRRAQRPDVGILSLKRRTDEHLLRAALDAGADACCLATTSQTRLTQAIKAVAEGATWLDPEISRILLHPAPGSHAAGGSSLAARVRHSPAPDRRIYERRDRAATRVRAGDDQDALDPLVFEARRARSCQRRRPRPPRRFIVARLRRSRRLASGATAC